MKTLKKALDPDNLMNPGKVLPHSELYLHRFLSGKDFIDLHQLDSQKIAGCRRSHRTGKIVSLYGCAPCFLEEFQLFDIFHAFGNRRNAQIFGKRYSMAPTIAIFSGSCEKRLV